MPRVLVTGATGFVGTNLVPALLSRGESVRCLVRSPERGKALAQQGAELIAGDLDQQAALARAVTGIDVVYHLAALTKSVDPQEMFRVNQAGTANLMQACAELQEPPVVAVVSSIAAAGPVPRGQVRTEADPPAPISFYGKSKLGGEQAAEEVAGSVPVTIVRPGAVFGPYDRGFLQIFRLIRVLRAHGSFGLRPPPMSWIYVGDLVELTIRAAERGQRVPPATSNNAPAGQGRYFAAAPEYPTWSEMGRIVRPMLDRPFAPLLHIPGPVAWCVAAINELIGRVRGKALWLNCDKIREALVTSWACSGEAAQRDLDFAPPKLLAERFAETIAWYKQQRLIREGYWRLY
jgi:nucleoside-diphosphate-sugar epimerase